MARREKRGDNHGRSARSWPRRPPRKRLTRSEAGKVRRSTPRKTKPKRSEEIDTKPQTRWKVIKEEVELLRVAERPRTGGAGQGDDRGDGRCRAGAVDLEGGPRLIARAAVEEAMERAPRPRG